MGVLGPNAGQDTLTTDPVETAIRMRNEIKKTRALSLILGAEGVYVGTLFITSFECPASDECKQDIVNAKTEDLIEVGTIQTWRCTPHKLSLELHEMEQKGDPKEEIDTKLSNGSLRLGMREGNLDAGIVSVSNAAGLIKSIKSCKEIVDDLMKDVVF